MKQAKIKFNGVTFLAQYDGEDITMQAVALDTTDYIGISKLNPRRFYYKMAIKRTAAWACDIQRANSANRASRHRNAGISSVAWAPLDRCKV